jgi:putative transposase
MLISERIEFDPIVADVKYFAQACGCSRFTWNWGLGEWIRQYQAGQKPNAMALKKQFNAIKYRDFPWIEAIHRDAHAQPFAHLAKAWSRFFADIKAGKPSHAPVFKKKGVSRDSFYIANDKLTIEDRRVRLPKIGWIKLKESPRHGGKIMGASVSREADRWFISIQFDVDKSMLVAKNRREKMGVDLNTGSIDLSDGRPPIEPPKPLKNLGDRLARLQRKASHKLESAKVASGIPKNKPWPKGRRPRQSNNLRKLHIKVARLHARISHIRNDFLHKLTTDLCRNNQAITVEDLNVRGMTASSRGTIEEPGKRVSQKSGLNRSMLDVGFGEFRRQLQYKSQWYGVELTMADRFFPSSQLCSTPGCDYRNKALKLKDRKWTCPQCGVTHSRDLNAAINLENYVPRATREVKPVIAKADMRDASQGHSGQESNRDHFRSHLE